MRFHVNIHFIERFAPIISLNPDTLKIARSTLFAKITKPYVHTRATERDKAVSLTDSRYTVNLCFDFLFTATRYRAMKPIYC